MVIDWEEHDYFTDAVMILFMQRIPILNNRQFRVDDHQQKETNNSKKWVFVMILMLGVLGVVTVSTAPTLVSRNSHRLCSSEFGRQSLQGA